LVKGSEVKVGEVAKQGEIWTIAVGWQFEGAAHSEILDWRITNQTNLIRRRCLIAMSWEFGDEASEGKAKEKSH